MPIAIITGPPGAGKSTVASHLAASSRLGVHLAGDQVFHWVAGGYVPPWMPGTSHQNGTVISAIAAAAVQFADAGYDVFVDGIIGPWFLPHWLQTAGRGRPTHYFVLRPSRQIAASRATGRRAPGDLVDPHPVAAMFDVFEDLGSFEAHVLDSSSQDIGATVTAIQERIRDGRYVLDSSYQEIDMDRLARKFGVDPPNG
jgi:hypothetical protein